MMTQTRIAVTNRTICYDLYKQAGFADAEDTPLTCLSRQIRALLDNNSYDKILIREKDLSEDAYRTFMVNIFSTRALSLNTAASCIIVHNFPEVAEEFGSDLHLPFSIFTDLLGLSSYSAQNNSHNFLSDNTMLTHTSPVVTSDNDLTHGTSVITSNNDLTHGTSVITSENDLTHASPVATSENVFPHRSTNVSSSVSSESFRKKYPHIQRMGTSIHSVEDAIFAESHGADYITAGHIFTTNCKKGLPGRGIEWLKTVCDAVSIPVYAIGGISDANAGELSDCGIAGYCMMSASMQPAL